MILKIKNGTQWWIYDNIVKIRWSMNFEKRNQKCWDESYADVMLLETQQGKDSDEYVEVCYRDKYNDERIVAFNEIAYLCNDDGKTIEKIVGPLYS